MRWLGSLPGWFSNDVVGRIGGESVNERMLFSSGVLDFCGGGRTERNCLIILASWCLCVWLVVVVVRTNTRSYAAVTIP